MRKLLVIFMLMVGSFAYAEHWVKVCDSKIGMFFVDEDYTNPKAAMAGKFILKVKMYDGNRYLTTTSFFEYKPLYTLRTAP